MLVPDIPLAFWIALTETPYLRLRPYRVSPLTTLYTLNLGATLTGVGLGFGLTTGLGLGAGLTTGRGVGVGLETMGGRGRGATTGTGFGSGVTFGFLEELLLQGLFFGGLSAQASM